MDGTFKVAPNGFTQLYTIHAWGEFEFEAVPIVHVVLRSKTVATYTYVLQQIRNKVEELHGGIGNVR